MQTVHQWSRGRSKCIALQNPPLLHNLQAEASSDGSGLTAGFQAMYAGIPAQTVFDTGADNNVIHHAFAQRIGIHVVSTSPSQVQLADASAVLATGVLTSTLHIQDYQGILRCHVASLDLPCDLIVGESWMRKYRASVMHGLEGARAVTLFKGRRKVCLVPTASHSTHSASTTKISAMQSPTQMKPKLVLFGDTPCA